MNRRNGIGVAGLGAVPLATLILLSLPGLYANATPSL